MKELNDKDLEQVFKKLSDKEAPVSNTSWSKISGKVAKPGFWQFSWTHLNVFYTAFLAVIVGGVVAGSLYFSENESRSMLKTEVPEQVQVSEKSATAEGKIQKAASSPDLNINKELKPAKTVPSKAEKGDLFTKKKEQEIKQNSQTENGQVKTEQPEIAISTPPEKISNPVDSAISKDVKDSTKNTKAIKPESPETAKSDSISPKVDKAPVGKKIIVFEEDTIIKVDTIKTNKRRKRNRD